MRACPLQLPGRSPVSSWLRGTLAWGPGGGPVLAQRGRVAIPALEALELKAPRVLAFCKGSDLRCLQREEDGLRRDRRAIQADYHDRPTGLDRDPPAAVAGIEEDLGDRTQCGGSSPEDGTASERLEPLPAPGGHSLRSISLRSRAVAAARCLLTLRRSRSSSV